MNAIRHNRIGVTTQADGSIDIVVPAGMAKEFKELVARATNTWQDQHVEIRDFKDRLFGQDTVLMKQELYGYPKYPEPAIVSIDGGGAKDVGIISQHWDIPSEDKYMIGSQEQAVVVKKDF